MKIENIKKIEHLNGYDKDFLTFCYEIVENSALPQNWKEEKFLDHVFLNTTNMFHALSLCENPNDFKEFYNFFKKEFGQKKIDEFLLMKQVKSYHGTPLDKVFKSKNHEIIYFLAEKLSKKILKAQFYHGETHEKDEEEKKRNYLEAYLTNFWSLYFEFLSENVDKNIFKEKLIEAIKKGFKIDFLCERKFHMINKNYINAISDEYHLKNNSKNNITQRIKIL